jgi:hypothetical protein
MDFSDLPGKILFVLFFLIAAGGVWYFGIRRGSRFLKTIAFFLCVVPVLGIALEILNYFEVFRPTEFRLGTVFQPDLPADAWRDGPTFHLDEDEAERRHELEITIEVWGGTPPKGPIQFGVSVLAPKGNVIAEQLLTTSPAPGKLRWLPVTLQFQPLDRGNYNLRFQVPKEAGSANILLRELKSPH